MTQHEDLGGRFRGRRAAPKAAIANWHTAASKRPRVLGDQGAVPYENPIAMRHLMIAPLTPTMSMRDWRDDPLEALDAAHEDRNGRLPGQKGYIG